MSDPSAVAVTNPSVKEKVADAKQSLQNTDSPIHVFNPNDAPEAKAERVLKDTGHPGLVTASPSPGPDGGGSATGLRVQIDAQSKGQDPSAAAVSMAPNRSDSSLRPSLRDAAKQISREAKVASALQDEVAPLPEPSSQKEQEGTIADIKSYVGWSEVSDAPKDFFERHIPEVYYGKGILNSLSVIIVGVLTWFIVAIGLGFAWCIPVWACFVVYYNTSTTRYRRNVKDDLIRELAVPRLESGTESVEWMNSFLSRFWIIYEPVLSATIVTSVDAVLADSTPAFLDSLRLSTFTLGSKAPRIEEIRTFPNTEQDIVQMDWRLSFVPASTDDASVKTITNRVNSKIVLTVRVGKGFVGAGIPILLEDFVFKGLLRIRIKLMSAFPHVQIVDISFLEPPTIDYVLKPIGGETLGFDIAHLPGLAPFIRDTIHSNLAPMMYAPNVFTLDVATMMGEASDADSACGVIKLTIRSAKALKHGDLLGTPDPYIRVRIGGRDELCRTEIRENTVNPIWDQTFFLLVQNLDEKMSFEIMDWNNMKKDSVMGSAEYDLTTLQNEPEQEDVQSKVTKAGKDADIGVLRFAATYHPVAPPIKDEDGTEKPIDSNIGILRLTINQAKELNARKSLVGQLSPYALLKFNGKQVKKTKILKRNNAPVWEETLEIFCPDLKAARLALDIRDDRDLAQDPVLGTWKAKATDVLARSAKATDWYTLEETGGGGGKIRFNAVWRPIVMDSAHAGSLAPVAGVVRLHAIEGAKLHNTETTGVADPYLRVMVGMHIRGKTQVIDSNLNPKWDRILYIPVHGPAEAFVLQVMDWNNHIKDKIIGETVVQVGSLLERVEEDAPIQGRIQPIADEKDTSQSPASTKKVTRYTSKGISDLWSGLTSQSGKNRGNIHYTAEFHPIIPLTPEDDALLIEGDVSPDAAAAVAPKAPIDWTQYQSGVMQITIHEARGFKKPFNAVVELLVNRDDSNVLHRTRVLKNTLTPDWEEACEAFIPESEVGLVTFVVRHGSSSDGDEHDYESNPTLGKCELRVIDILRDMPSPTVSPIIGSDKASAANAATNTDADANADADADADDGSGKWYGFDVVAIKTGNTVTNSATAVLSSATGTSVGGSVEGATAELRLSFKFSPIDVTIDFSESYLDQGILDFEVVSAKDLHAADASGTSDPYVVVFLGEERLFKTKTVKKSLHPTFKEVGPTTPIISRTKDQFVIEVYDWNKVEKNELLGRARVDLLSLEPMLAQNIDVPLSSGGFVTLRATFRPTFLSSLGPKASGMLTSIGTTALNAVNPINQAKNITGLGKTVVGGAIGSVSGLFGKKKAHPPSAAPETNPAIQVIGSNVPGDHPVLAADLGGASSTLDAPQHMPPSSATTSAAAYDDPTASGRSIGHHSSRSIGHQSTLSVDSTVPPHDISSAGNIAGMLTLHILEAKNLLAADRGGTSDPYIKVIMTSAGGKHHTVHKTKVIKKTLAPQWANESISIPVDADSPVIQLSVKDQNTFGGDKDIGEYDLRIFEELGLLPSDPPPTGHISKEIWTPPGSLAMGGEGQIHIRLEFSPESHAAPSIMEDGKKRSGGLFGLKKKSSQNS